MHLMTAMMTRQTCSCSFNVGQDGCVMTRHICICSFDVGMTDVIVRETYI